MTGLVSGSAIGLGSKFATWLAERGYNLILHYNTSEKEAENLKSKLEESFGIKCYLWRADLSVDFIESLSDFLDKNELNVDVLINNVGNFLYKPIEKLLMEDIRDVMSTNFESTFAFCEFFVPRMKELVDGRTNVSGSHDSKKHIINITCSGAEGLVYREKTAFYHYAKSGVHLTTQLWAQNLAGSNITINSIAPGVLPDSVYKDTISSKHWTSYEEVKQAFNYLMDSDPVVNGINIDLSKGWKPGAK